MGYHLEPIKKGKLGEFSKIKEEFEELSDAFLQDDPVLIINELTDLVGAIEAYAGKWNLTLSDLKSFSDKTKSAFIDGTRK